MDTISLFLSTIQWFDYIIKVAHSAHNSIGAEVAMKELGGTPFFPDGTINKHQFALGETCLPSPSVVAFLLLGLDGCHPFFHFFPYLRQLGGQGANAFVRVAVTYTLFRIVAQCDVNWQYSLPPI